MKAVIFAAVASLILAPSLAHAEDRAGTVGLQVSFFDVIPTGFQQSYPMTFAYSANGDRLAVFAPTENEQLKAFLKSHKAKAPVTEMEVSQFKKFEGILDLNGETVQSLNPGKIKLFTLAADPSVGSCPPCIRRDALISPALAKPSDINYQYITFVTKSVR